MKIKQDSIGIGENLASLRKKAGFSQSQFIRELHLLGFSHISVSIYKSMEHNRYNIRVSELMAILQVLQTKLDDIDYNDFFSGLTIEEFKDLEY